MAAIGALALADTWMNWRSSAAIGLGLAGSLLVASVRMVVAAAAGWASARVAVSARTNAR